MQNGHAYGIRLQSSSLNNIGYNVISQVAAKNGTTNGWPPGDGGNSTGISLVSCNSNNITFNIVYKIRGGEGGTIAADSGQIGRPGEGVNLFSSSSNNVSYNIIYEISGGNGGDGDMSTGDGGLGVGIHLESTSLNNVITQNNVYNITGGNEGPWEFYNEGYWDHSSAGLGIGIYLSTSTSNNAITQNNIYNIIGGNGSECYSGDNHSGGNSIAIFMTSSTYSNITSNSINHIKGGTGANRYYDEGDGGNGTGISLQNTLFTTITRNVVSNCTGGIGGTSDVGAKGPDGIGVSILLNSSSQNLCYDNYLNNTNNAYDDGNNRWNISKTLGTNIIGGPYLGGNYWSDYNGTDMNNDGLGDTNLPYGPGDYLPLVIPVERLDQQQTQYKDNFVLYTTRWGGQSFKPTVTSLTRAVVFMRKAGSPASDVVLSVRSSLSGADLVSIAKPASQIPTTNSWVEFDFSDLTVTPGRTYYLVLKTNSGNNKNCYNWGYGTSTPYTNGMQWTSTNSGKTWTQFTKYDFCFKTYGIPTSTAPVLSYTPSSYNFGNIAQGGTGSTSFKIWNNGTGTLTYNLSKSSSWVTVTPTSGNSSGEHDTITVNIKTAGLSPGSYTCPVGISSDGGSGTFTVSVAVIQPIEVLDQQQTQYKDNFVVYTTRWGGQSFKPTVTSLTRVEVYIRKAGSPASDVVLSVRRSLTGTDLVSIAKPASQIPTSNGWVEFDFSDLTVTPGNTYYLVLKTTSGTSKNCYYWGYGTKTPYTNGMQWNSANGGSTWTQYASYDFCFKTYGFK